jgi:hypothetical protein
VVFTLVLGILFCVRCCCVGKRCCLLPWSGYSFEPLLINAGLVIFGLCFLGLIGLGVLGNVWSHEGINNTSVLIRMRVCGVCGVCSVRRVVVCAILAV